MFMVTWKVICVAYVFLHAEFKYIIRISLSPTVVVWLKFLKFSFSEFSFLSRYRYVLNMAEAICFIAIPVRFKYGWGNLFYRDTGMF